MIAVMDAHEVPEKSAEATWLRFLIVLKAAWCF
jgi:hypothetical protein